MREYKIRNTFCSIAIVGFLIGLTGCSGSDSYTLGSVKYETTISVSKDAVAEESAYGMSYDFVLDEEETGAAIHINQIGYEPQAEKIAIVTNSNGIDTFDLVDDSGNIVYTGNLSEYVEVSGEDNSVRYADFSDFSAVGTYYVMCGNEVSSYRFDIMPNVYSEQLNNILCSYRFNHVKKTKDVIGGWKFESSETIQSLDVIMACANLLLSEELFYDELQCVDEYLNMQTSRKRSIESKETMEIVEEKSSEFVSMLLEEVRYGLQWLLNMQDPVTGDVYNKVGGSYKGDTEEIVYGSSTNVTAGFAAVMAMASRTYMESDLEFSARCLEAAQKAWNYLEDKKEVVVFVNPEGVSTKAYTDEKDSDERYWAATELFKTTHDSKYHATIRQFVATQVEFNFLGTEVAGYGNLAYLTTDISYVHEDLMEMIKAEIENQVEEMKNRKIKEIYRVDMEEDGTYGLNHVIDNALTLIFMGHALEDETMLKEAFSYADYLLGINPYSCNYLEYSLDESENEIWVPFYSTLFVILSGIS